MAPILWRYCQNGPPDQFAKPFQNYVAGFGSLSGPSLELSRELRLFPVATTSFASGMGSKGFIDCAQELPAINIRTEISRHEEPKGHPRFP
jgi:hypothetical protein